MGNALRCLRRPGGDRGPGNGHDDLGQPAAPPAPQAPAEAAAEPRSICIDAPERPPAAAPPAGAAETAAAVSPAPGASPRPLTLPPGPEPQQSPPQPAGGLLALPDAALAAIASGLRRRNKRELALCSRQLAAFFDAHAVASLFLSPARILGSRRSPRYPRIAARYASARTLHLTLPAEPPASGDAGANAAWAAAVDELASLPDGCWPSVRMLDMGSFEGVGAHAAPSPLAAALVEQLLRLCPAVDEIAAGAPPRALAAAAPRLSTLSTRAGRSLTPASLAPLTALTRLAIGGGVEYHDTTAEALRGALPALRRLACLEIPESLAPLQLDLPRAAPALRELTIGHAALGASLLQAAGAAAQQMLALTRVVVLDSGRELFTEPFTAGDLAALAAACPRLASLSLYMLLDVPAAACSSSAFPQMTQLTCGLGHLEFPLAQVAPGLLDLGILVPDVAGEGRGPPPGSRSLKTLLAGHATLQSLEIVGRGARPTSSGDWGGGYYEEPIRHMKSLSLAALREARSVTRLALNSWEAFGKRGPEEYFARHAGRWPHVRRVEIGVEFAAVGELLPALARAAGATLQELDFSNASFFPEREPQVTVIMDGDVLVRRGTYEEGDRAEEVLLGLRGLCALRVLTINYMSWEGAPGVLEALLAPLARVRQPALERVEITLHESDATQCGVSEGDVQRIAAAHPGVVIEVLEA